MPLGNNQMYDKILTIVIVPVMIILGLIVYGNFATTGNTIFEVTVDNESVSGITNPEVVTVNSPPVVNDSQTTYHVYNDTSHTDELTEGTEYEVVSLEDGKFNITSDVKGTAYFKYTGHGGDGFAEKQAVDSNTYSGFNLASVLPIVLAGVAVLAVVISAFVGLS